MFFGVGLTICNPRKLFCFLSCSKNFLKLSCSKNLSELFLKFMSDVETAEEPGSANYDKWHSALLQKAVHELWRKSEVCWTGTWNTNMNPEIQNVLKRYTSLNRKSVKDAFIRSALNSEHSIAPRQRGPKF